MQYSMSDIRKNLKIIIDGVPYTVVESQFVKPGKGQAFTRTRVKNLITGAVLEKTFRQTDSFEKAEVEERQQQFLYPEGESYVFMDTANYEQLYLSKEQLGEQRFFLLDGMMVDVLFWNEKPIGVTPPTFVQLEVTETEPGFKGDTSNNTLKPAKTNSGADVHVPLFINVGDVLKIDTRTGEYVERVSVGRK